MSNTQPYSPERTTQPPYAVVQGAVTQFGIAPAGMTINSVTDHLISERARNENQKFGPDMAERIARDIEHLCNRPGVDRGLVWKLAACPEEAEPEPETVKLVRIPGVRQTECLCGCGRVFIVPVEVQAVVAAGCSLDAVFKGVAERLANPGPEPVTARG